MNQEIQPHVRQLIAKKLRVEPDLIKSSSSFIRDLGADSLDVVELVVAVEQEYSVQISNEDAEKLRTVGAVCDFLRVRGRV